MDDLLRQLPALLGVLVGTVGTIVATTLADRSRWTRNLAVRWDERRLGAYTDYASLLKEIVNVLVRMKAPSRPGSLSAPLDHYAGIALLDELKAQRAKAWERVLLIGDPSSIAAADQWRLAVRELEEIAAGAEFDISAWRLTVNRVDHAREVFYDAARGALAAPGGSFSAVVRVVRPSERL